MEELLNSINLRLALQYTLWENKLSDKGRDHSAKIIIQNLVILHSTFLLMVKSKISRCFICSPRNEILFQFNTWFSSFGLGQRKYGAPFLRFLWLGSWLLGFNKNLVLSSLSLSLSLSLSGSHRHSLYNHYKRLFKS